MILPPRIGLFFLALAGGFGCGQLARGEELPDPFSASREAGRLVGWGVFNPSKTMEDTLPLGWDAEGFVQVEVSRGSWLALHRDGWALRHTGERVVHEKRIVQVGLAGGHRILLFEDGSVRTEGDSRTQPPPEGVEDVVQVEGGSYYFGTLNRKGELTLWHTTTANAGYGTGYLPRTGVRAFDCFGHCVGVTLENGTHLGIIGGPGVRFNAEALGSPIRSFTCGFNHLLGLSPDGKLLAAGTTANAGASAAGKVPPELEGRFVRVKAFDTHSFAQRDTGEWVFWGEAVDKEADLERLNAHSLLDFGVFGEARSNRGFLLGLQRSLVDGMDLEFTAVPEVREVLKGVQARLDSRGAKIEAFEARYLTELDKLEEQARKANQVAVVRLLEEEREQFRDRARPLAKHPQVARLQSVYRKQIPALEEERERLRLEAYQVGVDELQRLQDGMTAAKRLALAVEARRVKEELSRCHTLLGKPRREGSSGPVVVGRSAFRFSVLTAAERRFSLDDPLVPGELVVLGDFDGVPLEVPREAFRGRYTEVVASDCWLALRDNGDVFCQGRPGDHRLSVEGVPSEVSRLSAIFRANEQRGYYAADRSGRLVHWGVTSTSAWKDSLPEAARTWEDVTDLAMVPGPNATYRQLLALHGDGTVSAVGTDYEEATPRWTNLARGTNDNVAVVAHSSYAGVLKRDGSVLLWNEKGPFRNTAQFGKVAKFVPSGGVYAIRRDGTLTGLTLSNGNLWTGYPKGIDEVVDLYHWGELYALRADGRWYRWNPGEASPAVQEVPELRGVRRLAVGGKGKGRYLIGIRPPSKR